MTVISVCTLAAQAPARIRGPVNLNATVRLAGNLPRQLRGAVDRGAAPPGLQLNHILLVLRRSPAQQAALSDFLDAQREQDSGSYHDWLTPSQFGQRFGPAPSDIATVVNWLTTAGFQVNRVAAGEGVIDFSGDAATVARAFHTTIHRYAVAGAAHWANAENPAIPAALAPVVAGVVSLNDFRKPAMIRPAEISAGPVTSPDLNYTDQNGVQQHALIPGDLDTIYDLKPLVSGATTGAGETIALVGRAEPNTEDFNDFRSTFMAGAASNVLTVIPVGTPSGLSNSGDQAEATLDTEWAGAAAPGAQLDLVYSTGTASTDGVDLAAEYVVDHNLAPLMSTTFGGCEAEFGAAENAFWNNLWEQAAAEGITSLVASGDNGAAGCDSLSGSGASYGLAVSGLASTPFDTAVGGTEFNDTSNPGAYWNTTVSGFAPSALGYIPELPWTEHIPASGSQPEAWGAGSGGASQVYVKPVWQTGAGVPPDGHRDLPDVALTAAGHDGYVVCWDFSCGSNGFYIFGGTSASSPVMAGVMALVDQATGDRQGLVNPILYRLAAADTAAGCSTSSGANCVFHDVTVGNNDVPCVAGSPDCGVGGELGFNAVPGFDLATGWGSIDVAHLAQQWNSITFAKSTTTFQLGAAVNPQQITVGQSIPFTLSVAGANGGPTPTGEVELLAESAAADVLAATFTLDSSGAVNTSTTALPAGTYNLVARYAGDANYGASRSAAIAVAVAKGTPTIHISFYTTDAANNLTPVTEAPYGTPIIIAVRVTGSTATPTGTVSIKDNLDPLNYGTGTYDLSVGGDMEVPATTQLPAGLNRIAVQYSGDSNYNTTQAQTDLTLDKLATTLKISGYTEQQVTVDLIPAGALAKSNYCYDSYLPDNLSVNANGAVVATGFTTQTTVDGAVVCRADATFKQPLPGTSVTLTANFAGTSELLPSSSDPVTIPTPPNLVITPASLDFGTVMAGTTKTLSATLTNQGGQDATYLRFENLHGNYVFTEKDACGGKLAAGASCALSFSYVAQGEWPTSSDQIQVLDGGLPGTTVSLSATNSTYQLQGSNSLSFTTSAGQPVTFPLTIAPVNGYQGPVTFACSDLPPLANCSFAPAATINLNGSDPVTMTVSISTTGVSATARAWPAGGDRGWGWLFTGIFGIGACWAFAARRRGLAAFAGATVMVIALVSCGGGAPASSPAPSGGSSGSGGPGGSGGGGTTTTHALKISSSSLNFGTVGVKNQSSPQSVTITNTGSDTPTSLNTYADPPFQVSNNGCTAALAPGATCTVSVLYAPQYIGASTGALRVWDGWTGVQATLTGQGQYVSTPANNYAIVISANPGSTPDPTALPVAIVSLTVK